MANLEWKTQRNLENSLIEFLQEKIIEESLTVPNVNGVSTTVNVGVGWEFNKDWSLPIIKLYMDSKLSPRLSIGSNLRQKSYLLVIDIHALDIGSQLDLTEWIEETINDGFVVYEYTSNVADPEETDRARVAYASVNFLTNAPVRFSDATDLYEKFRQNITIEVTLSQC